MAKRKIGSRLRTPNLQEASSTTHGLSNPDLWLHARSFHAAAKKLAGGFKPDSGPFTEFDVYPVVFMYRHAVELHLKTILLGEGGNFLATKPDPISVSKTHSVSWLAQFVCQIVATLEWKTEFTCEGIESLDDFKKAVESVNLVDPGFYTFRCPVNVSSLPEFVRKMDALLDLLSSTADALAAEWDMRVEGFTPDPDIDGSGGFGPTIQ